MKHVFSLFFIFIFFNAAAQEELYNPMELKEDLSIYKRGVFELHPDAFHWYPQDSFAIWIEQVEQELTLPMTSLDFRKLLFPVHQKVGCGHSRISASEKQVKARKKAFKKGEILKGLPFNGKVYEGKFYVLKDLTKDSLLARGTEITAIDDLPVANIIDSLSRFLTSDGYNQTHFPRAMSKFFSPFYNVYFGTKDEYKLGLRDSSGIESSIRVAARLSSKQLNKERARALKKKEDPPAPAEPVAKTKKLIFKNKKGYRLWNSLQDTSLFILRIPAFAGSAGIRFHKKSIKYLNSLKQPHHLILDLRGNGGGNANEAFTLVTMLCADTVSAQASAVHKFPKDIYRHLTTNSFARARHQFWLKMAADEKEKGDTIRLTIHHPPHKRVRYTGPLSVFIDGYSFSASSLVSSYLRDQDRATFYGEESGGGQFGTNALTTPYLVFPNTGIRVRMPTYRLHQLVDGENIGRGIFPDVKTTWTIEDVLEKKDVDLGALIDAKN